jgi:hypothetical protein
VLLRINRINDLVVVDELSMRHRHDESNCHRFIDWNANGDVKDFTERVVFRHLFTLCSHYHNSGAFTHSKHLAFSARVGNAVSHCNNHAVCENQSNVCGFKHYDSIRPLKPNAVRITVFDEIPVAVRIFDAVQLDNFFK